MTERMTVMTGVKSGFNGIKPCFSDWNVSIPVVLVFLVFFALIFGTLLIVYFGMLHNSPPASFTVSLSFSFALHSLNCSVLCAANPVN